MEKHTRHGKFAKVSRYILQQMERLNKIGEMNKKTSCQGPSLILYFAT